MKKINVIIPAAGSARRLRPFTNSVPKSLLTINGKSIIQLFNGQANTGNNILYWDGINQYGKEVPSGTYFLVIKNDNITRKQKILLLK